MTRFPETPGWVFTRLAEETLIKEGRWAGEAQAITYLQEAVLRDDPEGTRLLGQMLIHFRQDPAQFDRAVSLLTEAVERHGLAPAMQDLDAAFRCQAPDAPRLTEAEVCARPLARPRRRFSP